MAENIKQRIDRLERETGITEKQLEQEFREFARKRGLKLMDHNVADYPSPKEDFAIYEVTGALNLTDMKDIQESFFKARIEPQEDGVKLIAYK